MILGKGNANKTQNGRNSETVFGRYWQNIVSAFTYRIRSCYCYRWFITKFMTTQSLRLVHVKVSAQFACSQRIT